MLRPLGIRRDAAFAENRAMQPVVLGQTRNRVGSMNEMVYDAQWLLGRFPAGAGLMEVSLHLCTFLRGALRYRTPEEVTIELFES